MNQHLAVAGRRCLIFSLSPSPKGLHVWIRAATLFFAHNLFAYYCAMVQHAEPS